MRTLINILWRYITWTPEPSTNLYLVEDVGVQAKGDTDDRIWGYLS